MSSDTPFAEGGQLVGSLRASSALRSLLAKLAGSALILGSILSVTVVSSSAAGSLRFKVSNSQNLPPGYSNWPKNAANWPCYATPSYTCTQGGYDKSAAENSGWPWTEYGGANASENKYGPHNCTLYAAFRLAENGVADPGNLGNAVSWATNAAAKGIQVNQTPKVGAIAQWNAGGGGDGHVAYVESVDAGGSGITITEDNFVPATATSFPGGYTAEVHITSASAVWPANFIHFPTSTPPPVVTNYTGTGINGPQGIVTGPDGALWFTNDVVNSGSIGRITTAGKVTTYSGTGIDEPVAITVGSDGALWFTNPGNNSIGRITTAGKVTNYTGPGISFPFDITAGADGALWFTNADNNSIGRVTTAGKVTNYTGPGISGSYGIVAGPDGALWFTNADNNSIGRITTAGKVTNYTGPGISFPFGITAGVDGALWFTNDGTSSIGRLTTAGKGTNYTAVSVNSPYGIAAGSDGALWFTNQGDGTIGRVTTAGVITDYTGVGVAGPQGITAGPDGALWFTNSTNNSIGRITTG